MNPLMVAQYLGARIYSAELTAAAWLDNRRFVRLLPLACVHQGVRPWLPAGIAVAAVTLGHPSRTAAVVIIIASLVAVSFSRIAAKSHYVLNEEDRPCPYCPADDDGDLPGGKPLTRSGGPADIPPAPALMLDYDFDDDDIPPAPNELTVITEEGIRESLDRFNADYAEVCRKAASR